MMTSVANIRDLYPNMQGGPFPSQRQNLPENHVYIGRPSKWGNPFTIGKDGIRTEVIAKYKKWLFFNYNLYDQVEELRGKVLVCWCKPLACHGDVLAAIADGDLVQRIVNERRLLREETG